MRQAFLGLLRSTNNTCQTWEGNPIGKQGIWACLPSTQEYIKLTLLVEEDLLGIWTFMIIDSNNFQTKHITIKQA